VKDYKMGIKTEKWEPKQKMGAKTKNGSQNKKWEPKQKMGAKTKNGSQNKKCESISINVS